MLMQYSVYVDKKFCLRVFFEKNVAEISDCDFHQNTTHTLNAVCQTIPQFYSATSNTDSGNCWCPTSSISRIESVSKMMGFFADPRY